MQPVALCRRLLLDRIAMAVRERLVSIQYSHFFHPHDNNAPAIPHTVSTGSHYFPLRPLRGDAGYRRKTALFKQRFVFRLGINKR